MLIGDFLTAGLPGLPVSFFSSVFLVVFSGRWDGDPSDFDDAGISKGEK